MNTKEHFLYRPRKHNTIELWKDVSARQWNDPDWQMKNAIRTVEQLKKVISLTAFQAHGIEGTVEVLRARGKDPLRITPYHASLMQADPFHPVMMSGEKSHKRLDPVFWQSVPTPANLLFPNSGMESTPPRRSRSFGAAHQHYPNRVALLVAENTSCASYCVHCRKVKSPNGTADVNGEEIDKGLFYIRYNKNIDEVLLTGGDVLMINRNRLKYVLEELSRIAHVRVVCLVTRVPVVLPMAVNDDLMDLINRSVNRFSSGLPKYLYFMTRINHYQEITGNLAAAVSTVRRHGFTIRSQTVLLNHVNDYYKTLAETFRRMFWVGIHPYDLLQCHKAKGLVHFITPIQIGQIYMKHLQGWISGITIPQYSGTIEGGGRFLLMPSGHDTLNLEHNIEKRISASFATVSTWDGKEIHRYEALGRVSRNQYERAVRIMDTFIGRKGVFLPKVIIIDEYGRHIKTTNRQKLPKIENCKKSDQLKYGLFEDDTPLTNPGSIRDELEAQYSKWKISRADNLQEQDPRPADSVTAEAG